MGRKGLLLSGIREPRGPGRGPDTSFVGWAQKSPAQALSVGARRLPQSPYPPQQAGTPHWTLGPDVGGMEKVQTTAAPPWGVTSPGM